MKTPLSPPVNDQICLLLAWQNCFCLICLRFNLERSLPFHILYHLKTSQQQQHHSLQRPNRMQQSEVMPRDISLLIHPRNKSGASTEMLHWSAMSLTCFLMVSVSPHHSWTTISAYLVPLSQKTPGKDEARSTRRVNGYGGHFVSNN